MSNTTKCEFCGAELAARYIDNPLKTHAKHAPLKRIMIGYELCDCGGAQRDRIERMEREEARKAAERAQLIDAKMRKAGIPERYLFSQHEMAASMAESVATAGKGYYIDGPQGTGKTHLAYSVARLCVMDGIKTTCVSSTALMEAYRFRRKEDADLTRRLMACGLLVIDDLGKEAPTQYACERLFEVIDTRYNSMRPVIITSNYARGAIASKLAEGDVGKSIASRLNEMTQRIHIDGEDRRLNRG